MHVQLLSLPSCSHPVLSDLSSVPCSGACMNTLCAFQDCLHALLALQLSCRQVNPCPALCMGLLTVRKSGLSFLQSSSFSTSSFCCSPCPAAACKKGCTGPVLRAIQRFGRLGRRNTSNMEPADAAAMMAAPKDGGVKVKNAK